MANLNSLLGNSSSVAPSVVSAVSSSKMAEVIKHVNAGELVICLESNLGRASGNILFRSVGGGIYTYKANPGKAFMTTCPMGFSLAVKGDYSSAKSYYDRGEFTRLVPGNVDPDAPSLETLQQHLKDAKAMLSKASAKNRANIEMMILNLEEQIELAQADVFTSEVMDRSDWALICKNQGMTQGEIELFFPLNLSSDEVMDLRQDRSVKAVKVYFLLSNLSRKAEEIYPRKSNKNELDTLISRSADTGEERHGLKVTVTPIHFEFVEETFSHAKQLFMIDPVGFNKSAEMFAKKNSTEKTVEFISLDATVASINIRAKKLPQAQAMMEKYVADGIWLSDLESQLNVIANSQQFHSFGPAEFKKYIKGLHKKYPDCLVDDVTVSESEIKKGSLKATSNNPNIAEAEEALKVNEVAEEIFVNPLDVDAEIDAILTDLTE